MTGGTLHKLKSVADHFQVTGLPRNGNAAPRR